MITSEASVTAEEVIHIKRKLFLAAMTAAMIIATAVPAFASRTIW